MKKQIAITQAANPTLSNKECFKLAAGSWKASPENAANNAK